MIVVDFGGGTLDVAHVDESGFLRKPWGEPALGGRLFDDLFFRWLIDQNPGLELSPNEAMFAWQHECRQLKENFSNRWRTEGPEMKGFKGKVDLGEGERLSPRRLGRRVPQAGPALPADRRRTGILPGPRRELGGVRRPGRGGPARLGQ